MNVISSDLARDNKLKTLTGRRYLALKVWRFTSGFDALFFQRARGIANQHI
jgi:hypothetical protein